MRATTSAVSLRRQSLYTSILIRRFPMRPPSGAATIYRQSARNSAMRAGGLSSDLVRSAGKLALFDRARAGQAIPRVRPNHSARAARHASQPASMFIGPCTHNRLGLSADVRLSLESGARADIRVWSVGPAGDIRTPDKILNSGTDAGVWIWRSCLCVRILSRLLGQS